MALRLDNIAQGNGPFTPHKIKLLRDWLYEDWEAADIDRDIIKVITRLLLTIDSMKHKKEPSK